MKLFIHWLMSALAIIIAAILMPGVAVSGIFTAFVLAVVLGFINSVIKPILLVFALPINLVTLGLFTLVIDALLILLAASIVKGFSVAGFFTALLFSIVLAVVSSILHHIEGKD